MPSLQQAQKSTAAPVINFAAPRPRNCLSHLIEVFSAAERALVAAVDVDDAIPAPKGAPRILGGVNPAARIVTDGKPDIELPAHEWFYRSLEEIDRDRKLRLQEAKSKEERSEIQSRFSEYRAEFLRQRKVLAAPKAKRDAERKLSEAHRALAAAERKIVNYRPANPAEAATLLEYVACGTRYCFTNDERNLHTIMRNAAAAIRAAR
jgi:acetone carboxylase gamma subunit